ISKQARRVAPRRVEERVELAGVHQRNHGGAQFGAKLVPAAAPRRLSRHLVRSLGSFEPYLNRRVKAARLDDVRERMHWRLVAEVGEVTVQVVLELIAAAALRRAHGI